METHIAPCTFPVVSGKEKIENFSTWTVFVQVTLLGFPKNMNSSDTKQPQVHQLARSLRSPRDHRSPSSLANHSVKICRDTLTIIKKENCAENVQKSSILRSDTPKNVK